MRNFDKHANTYAFYVTVWNMALAVTLFLGWCLQRALLSKGHSPPDKDGGYYVPQEKHERLPSWRSMCTPWVLLRMHLFQIVLTLA